MNQKEIYLSFILFAISFVILLVTLYPYRPLATSVPTPPYTCPASEWVDCMPGPNQGIKLECTTEALNWFKLNCPNFKGAAL